MISPYIDQIKFIDDLVKELSIRFGKDETVSVLLSVLDSISFRIYNYNPKIRTKYIDKREFIEDLIKKISEKNRTKETVSILLKVLDNISKNIANKTTFRYIYRWKFTEDLVREVSERYETKEMVSIFLQVLNNDIRLVESLGFYYEIVEEIFKEENPFIVENNTVEELIIEDFEDEL